MFLYIAIKYLFSVSNTLCAALASKMLGEPGKSPANEELERIWNYVYDRQVI